MALAPIVPARRPGLGFVPIAAIPSIVQGAESIISGVTGATHKYGQPQFEGAERSRAQTYVYGIAAGSVRAGQLLLGQHQTDTSQYAQSYTSNAITQATAKYPDIMSAAQQAGPQHDSPDGYQGLLILSQENIPYTDQYAGYSTDTGNPPAGATAQLVQQLQALVQQGHVQGTPATGVVGVTGSGLGAKVAGVPIWLAGGLIVAFILTRKTRRV